MLHDKLCNVYKVYCSNYILNKWEVKLENTTSMKRVLKCNLLFESENELSNTFKLTSNYQNSKYR